MNKRGISKITAIAASLTLAAATVVVGSGTAAAVDLPTNLRITDQTANTVTLAWDPPDDAVRFWVRADGGRFQASESATVDEPTVTFHLHQGTWYDAEVAAYDADGGWSGRMDPEDRLTFRMPVDPDDPPVTTPTIVRAEVDPDTLGIVVDWEPSISEAGSRVTYWAGIKEEGGGLRTINTGELTTATFFVPPGKTYEVSVNATDERWRTARDTAEVTAPFVPPPSLPEDVRVTTSPGIVTVNWDTPSSGAPVKDYSVTLPDAPGGAQGQTTTDTTATFNVPPGGDLEVTVAARDWLSRSSDRTDPAAFILEPAEDWVPPSAPGNFRAASSQRGVLFEWDEPAEGVGPFTYHIFLDGSEVETIREDTQLDSPYFFECTHPWQTSSEFTVTATSFGFESPDSNSITLCF